MPSPAQLRVPEDAHRSEHSRGAGPAAARAAHDGATAPLVRALIDALPHRATHATGEAVVLDVEVDGFRCIVLSLARVGRERDDAVLLSPREQEIARMVAEGYPNKTIAAVLDISS